ncbi:MAG: hypothetical protein ACRCXB_05555 [Aeromonadaceae bacterium]
MTTGGAPRAGTQPHSANTTPCGASQQSAFGQDHYHASSPCWSSDTSSPHSGNSNNVTDPLGDQRGDIHIPL